MFVFYDTETTGLDRDFSQILQIALVFTDDDLNILSMKKLECRRNPWVVPSPGALLTTGFTPDDLKNAKLSHFEMMTEVSDWIEGRHWPLLFAGYNTLRFDDPVFSQNLAQNLLPHDVTRAVNDKNGQANGQMDVMQIVRAATVYMPGLLTLDVKNDKGAPSLSLGNVARQNGVSLNEDDAHDAMNDIKATIGVARLIMKSAPVLWRQMMQLSNVDGVNAFLAENSVFTAYENVYGRTRNIPAAEVVSQPDGKTHILFDVSFDPAPYLSMDEETLAAFLRRKYARDEANPPKPRPFMLVDKSAQPILMPLDASDAVLPNDFNEAQARARADMIARHPDFAEKLSKAAARVHAEENGWRKPSQPEQMIDTPLSPELAVRIQAWQHEFHATDKWEDRRDLVQAFYQRFEDDIRKDASLRRFPKFAGRLIFDAAPDVLSDDQRDGMMRHIAGRLLDKNEKAPYMTIHKARKELEQIEKERQQQGSRWAQVTDGQIRSLKLYYTALEKEYLPHAPADNIPAPVSKTPKPPKAGG